MNDGNCFTGQGQNLGIGAEPWTGCLGSNKIKHGKTLAKILKIYHIRVATAISNSGQFGLEACIQQHARCGNITNIKCSFR